MIKEIGFYAQPKKVGWRGWIKTSYGIYFVGLDGKITGGKNGVPYRRTKVK